MEAKSRIENARKFALICDSINTKHICNNKFHNHNVAQEWFLTFKHVKSLQQLKLEYAHAKYQGESLWNFITEENGHWIYKGPLLQTKKFPKIWLTIHGKHLKKKLNSCILLMQFNNNILDQFLHRDLFMMSVCEEPYCVYHSLFITNAKLVQQDFSKYFTLFDEWYTTYRILKNSFIHTEYKCLIYNAISEQGYAEGILFYGSQMSAGRVALTMDTKRWLQREEQVCHSHNFPRNCIHLNHIRIGSSQENMNDRSILGKRKYDVNLEQKVYDFKLANSDKTYAEIANDLDIDLTICKYLYNHKKRRLSGYCDKSKPLSCLDFSSVELKKEIKSRLQKLCHESKSDDGLIHQVPKSINSDLRYGTSVKIKKVSKFCRTWSYLLQDYDGYMKKQPNDKITNTCDVEGCISHLKLDTLSNIRIASMDRDLTDEQVRDIRKRFENGESMKSIAQNLNQTYNLVCNVVNRLRYKDVK